MPAVVHACECDGGHHNNYSPQGLRECGGSSSSSSGNGYREVNKDHHDGNDSGSGVDEKSRATHQNASSARAPAIDDEAGEEADAVRRRGRGQRRRRRRRCPETAEFDPGQISVSLRGRREPRLVQVRMCKGCWQNFKRRSDHTLDYRAWECYPRGLLPGGDDDDDDAAAAAEVVIVRLARLWPAAIWGELGRR